MLNYEKINEELTKIKIRQNITNDFCIRSITVVLILTILNYSGFMYDLVGYFATMKEKVEKGEYSEKEL